MEGLPQAGWYQDPHGTTLLRWWDGSSWTDDTKQPAPPQPGPPAPTSAPAADTQTASHVTHVTVAGTQLPSSAVTGHVTFGSGEVRKLASPGKRLGARLIDFAIVLTAQAIFGVMGLAAIFDALGPTTGTGGRIGGVVGVLVMSMLVGVVYEVVLTAKMGQTIGKMAVGAVVVRGDTGTFPNWGPAILRWCVPFLFVFVPVFGWLLNILVFASITWDSNHQGFHDRAANTVVVDKTPQLAEPSAA